MRAVLALAVLELRRFLADRFGLFFVFLLPLVLVGVLGLQAESQVRPHISLSGAGPSVTQLAERLGEAGVDVTTRPDREGVEADVAAGGSDLGVVVAGGGMGSVGTDGADGPAAPAGLDLELLAVDGRPHPVLAPVVQAAATEVAVASAHTEALVEAGVDAELAARVAAAGPEGWTSASVQAADSGPAREELAASGRFDLGAAGQLLVFVFLNTLTAASATIQARRSGALRRVLSAPVTSAQTVAGLALGRFVIALVQGAYIIGASSLLFGVRWGDLGAVLAVLAVFGLIAAGVALIVGVVMDAEGPASGLAVGGGLILAALGGCMVPLELFPATMRTVAHLTPHAWAYEALAEVQRRGGGVLDILPELGVLAGMALLVLAAGAALLRRSLARAV